MTGPEVLDWSRMGVDWAWTGPEVFKRYPQLTETAFIILINTCTFIKKHVIKSLILKFFSTEWKRKRG